MDNESEDKLKGISGAKRFSVPENYFEQLNRDIQSRVAEEKLKALTKGTGFTVPDLYFEQLSGRIEARLLPAEAKKTGKVVRLWRSDLMKYATAACFILAAFGLYVNNMPDESTGIAVEMANEQYLNDIDEQEIIDLVGEEPILQTNTTASEQELEAYILSNYSSNDIAANY
jgi:hypothetical protein